MVDHNRLQPEQEQGGNNTPMALVSYGIDSYNQATHLETINPLRSVSGGDTKPMIAFRKKAHAIAGGARLGDDGNIRHLEYL